MIKVAEQVYRHINDPLRTKEHFDAIYRELIDEGYNEQQISRGPFNSVILKLEDGEVHYVPSGKGVDEVIFKYENSENEME
ncbi:hypothetical protein [Brevibacillus agri]|uniref:hypothetical protein n=1 Tax=Brevibacillus agri TaxID=51101 RepID=UPI0018CF9B61|nr:hypothetical protein [Brevibacillus agri]MBG9564898.1 hypothetical protein [Brevibacillus agri]